MTTRHQTILNRLRNLVRNLGWATDHAWFYNLRVGRPQPQVDRELHALASTNPAYIGLCEAVGYDLPPLAGYQLVRDRSTASRANIAGYVRDDLPIVWEPEWTDLRKTWKRPHGPGQHEPRSYVTVRAARLEVTFAHAAPLTAEHDTLPAQREQVDALTRTLRPTISDHATRRRAVTERRRPRHLVWDSNRGPTEPGPGSRQLAARVKGIVMGWRIDNAVVTNTQDVGVAYEHRVDGVTMGSDHPHALRIRFRVWAWWLSPKSTG